MLVKIKFKSAKVVFTKTVRKKDGELTMIKESIDRVNGDKPRPDNMLISNKNWGNPFGTTDNLIHYEQVSNMLAALLGERPVSTFHTPIVDGKPLHSRIQELDDIAKNTFVKLDNIYWVESESNKEESELNKKVYCYEQSTGRKSGPSNSKINPTITWRRFKYMFVDEPEKLELCSSYFKQYLSKPFSQDYYGSIDEAIREIKNGTHFEEFVSLMTKIGLKGFFGKEKTVLRASGNNHRFAFVSQDTYTMPKISISGEFVMDVPSEIFNRLIVGKKLATYLDGGIATLEKWEQTGTYGIDYEDFYNMDEYKHVHEVDIRK